MLSRLLKDSLVYGIANAVQKMVPFFIIPIITGYLGQEAFKTYDVSFVYAYLFAWLIIAGQDAAASVLYFDEKKSMFEKDKVISHAFLIQLLILILFLILFLLFSDNWARLLFAKDISLAPWWVKALLILPGFVLLNYSLNVLLWQKRKKHYIMLCCLLTIVSISSVATTVLVFHKSLNAVFYCLIGSMTASGLAGIIAIKSYVFKSLRPINKQLLKKLLWIGIPFALTSFFHQLLPSIDRYFLIQHNYSDTLAVYALAAKIGALMNFGISAFVLAFTPYSLEKLNDKNAEMEISKIFREISVVAFLLIPVLLLFKGMLISLFADSSYSLSANLLPFFFFGWVFDLLFYFPLLGVYKSQKSYLQLFLFLIGTTIITIANLLLIPAYGLYGAAISFCVAKAMVFFISCILLRKHFRLEFHLGSFGTAFFLAVTSSYLVYQSMFLGVLSTLISGGAAILYFFAFSQRIKKAASI